MIDFETGNGRVQELGQDLAQDLEYRTPEPGGRAGLNPSIAHGREIFPSDTSSHTQLPYG